MQILERLWPPGSVAAGLAVLSLAVTLGLLLGAIRIRGLKLGVSGVLFSSLLLGQLGQTPKPEVLSFLRDFSLILFVYTIGLQVGPGFVDSLKAEGLRLNLLSIAVLLLGAAMTTAAAMFVNVDRGGATGLYSGAFTTTAGLAAGQEAVRNLLQPDADAQAAAARRAGLAYAVTYPFGMIGPVLAIALLRRLFGVNIDKERAVLHAAKNRRAPPDFLDIEITNPEMAAVAVKDCVFARQCHIIFSRHLRNGTVSVPTAETRFAVGDIVRTIGSKPLLDEFCRRYGRPSKIDLAAASSAIGRVDLIVTHTEILGQTLRELDLNKRHGVTITRVTRSGVDLAPTARLSLHFGDAVTAVGPVEGLKAVEIDLGNSMEALNRPHLIPIFVGIVLGILVGSIPVAVPGLQGGIRLGLAAGPMLVAIVLARAGKIGNMICYMPPAANQLFRDFGLAVFLACVGLQQGGSFLQNLFSGGGLTLVCWGAAITMIPVLLVAVAARWAIKLNFITLSGWVAGAMTSTPALLFAGELTQSDEPAMAYAAVAPLALIIPVFCCQALAAIK
ncbi:MAG TPA: putative transporter [Tepidisphaeraceae bacterium]|nr:putative transporter [Tepidisphaeraceae bacterium]